MIVSYNGDQTDCLTSTLHISSFSPLWCIIIHLEAHRSLFGSGQASYGVLYIVHLYMYIVSSIIYKN